MGAMGVMALALSVVGGAIGAGLGVGALSGMWGIPAVVAVATVGVVTVGVVGGGAGGGRGSVAACTTPADSACAPAAAGVPVVIPVVNDWPNDCGDNGAVAAAAAGGMPAAGTDGPPTPTAGALGGRGGETVHGGGGPGIGWLLPNAGVASDNIGALLRGSDKPGAD